MAKVYTVYTVDTPDHTSLIFEVYYTAPYLYTQVQYDHSIDTMTSPALYLRCITLYSTRSAQCTHSTIYYTMVHPLPCSIIVK